MAAQRHNLTIDLGTTWTHTFSYTFDGNPVDLTGQTAELKVTKPGNAGEVYATQTVDGPADGMITFVFEDEETATWTWRKGAYTIDLLSSDGDRTGLLWGSLTVRDRSDV